MKKAKYGLVYIHSGIHGLSLTIIQLLILCNVICDRQSCQNYNMWRTLCKASVFWATKFQRYMRSEIWFKVKTVLSIPYWSTLHYKAWVLKFQSNLMSPGYHHRKCAKMTLCKRARLIVKVNIIYRLLITTRTFGYPAPGVAKICATPVIGIS